MERIVTTQEMQQLDHYTLHQVGMPVSVLMERAALAVVEQLYQQRCDLTRVAVLCGSGNNGGDGVAIARLLKLKNIAVSLYLLGDLGQCSAALLEQLKIAEAYQLTIEASLPANFCQYSTVIDALVGVGLSRNIDGCYAATITAINQSGSCVVAVDIPSGICASSGKILGVAIRADLTIALGYNKLGLVLYPGAAYAGTVITTDIGIYATDEPNYCSLQPGDIAALLPIRKSYSNKGSFGKVLVIAGSTTMCGAAYLSAEAAYRTGAGLVQIYTPQANRDILLTQLPEALITTYLPGHIDERQLQSLIDWATVIVIGPGMGISDDTYQIVLAVLNHATKPVIIDADGLNVLAQDCSPLTDREYPIFITPHLGEMARLLNTTIGYIAEHLVDSAKQFTATYRVTCILKDTRTIVSSPVTNKIYINQSGNNGMATGGSGDVLTGMLAGLIAQGVDLSLAAPLGVYLHGVAGDHAAKRIGQRSMLARDIIDNIQQALATA